MKSVDARNVYTEAQKIGSTITLEQLYNILYGAKEKSGRWIKGDKTIQCSECKTILVDTAENRAQKVCPYCNAKMVSANNSFEEFAERKKNKI